MRTTLFSLSLIALAPTAAWAEKLGDHPAIVVQRLYARQGYDYASKFYPHPAWLYLLAEEPHRREDHPAVAIAQRQAETRAPAGADPQALRAGAARR